MIMLNEDEARDYVKDSPVGSMILWTGTYNVWVRVNGSFWRCTNGDRNGDLLPSERIADSIAYRVDWAMF